jgi:ABC-type Fe3+-citrate transport system substrate-binding protein
VADNNNNAATAAAKNLEKMSGMSKKLDRHDWILTQHEEDIQEIRSVATSTKLAVESIELTLNQIKYMAYGGIAVYTADSIGLLKVIKLALL